MLRVVLQIVMHPVENVHGLKKSILLDYAFMNGFSLRLIKALREKC